MMENNRLFKVIKDKKRLVTSYSQIESYLTCPLKWYYQYVEGVRVDMPPSPILEYGNAVHAVLEAYFKSWGRLNGEAMSEIYNREVKLRGIEWDDLEQGLKDTRDAVAMISRIHQLPDKYEKEGMVNLTKIEALFLSATPVGIEESFMLPFRFDTPVEIQGEKYEGMYISGKIDLRSIYKHKILGDLTYYVDHKTSKSLFSEEKLKTNLQFPIYCMWSLYKYKTLPKRCYYYFTRTGEYQDLEITQERVDESVKRIKYISSRMYDFKSDINQTPATNSNPNFPLCYWCDYGKYNSGYCKFSSSYQKKKIK